MKKLKFLIVVILMLSLTGCVKKYTATDEQTDAVAEYMASLLLENDKDYDQELVSMEEIEGNTSEDGAVTQTPSSTDTTSDTSSDSEGTSGTSDNSGGKTDNPDNSYSLSEVIGYEDFQFDYKSSILTEEYPDKYFDRIAEIGHKLLVVSISIKNISDSKQRINMYDKKIEFQLNTENNSPLLSFLENDLRYFDTDINAGKTKDGILIFQVPDDSEISDFILTSTYDGKTSIISLK